MSQLVFLCTISVLVSRVFGLAIVSHTFFAYKQSWLVPALAVETLPGSNASRKVRPEELYMSGAPAADAGFTAASTTLHDVLAMGQTTGGSCKGSLWPYGNLKRIQRNLREILRKFEGSLWPYGNLRRILRNLRGLLQNLRAVCGPTGILRGSYYLAYLFIIEIHTEIVAYSLFVSGLLSLRFGLTLSSFRAYSLFVSGFDYKRLKE